MSTLSTDQIRQYAQNAGFTGAALDTIVAIAEAESGGATDTVNTKDPYGGSFGVLQINGAHIKGIAGTAITKDCAFDAQCSFNYGYQLYTARGFQPWGTYTTGKYKEFMGKSLPGNVPDIKIPSVLTNSPGTTNPPVDGVQSLKDLLASMSGVWAWLSDPVRIMKLVGGLLLVAGAIYLLVSPAVSQAVKSAV